MKTPVKNTLKGLVLFLCSVTGANAGSVDLVAKNFQPIIFDDIPQTNYQFKDGQLTAKVRSSSSVLMMPFDKIKPVKEISLKWKLNQGDLKITSLATHKEKKGDDSLFRVGLLIHGDAPSIPFFAPAWIKKSSKILKLPSETLTYFFVSPLAKGGETWESPYSSSINNIAGRSTKQDGGWYETKHQFAKAQKLVGIWLLADGDNSKSDFEIAVRDLKLLP